MNRLLPVFFLLLVAATPVPVNTVRVPLDKLGLHLDKPGFATVESKPGQLSVSFRRGDVAFTCYEFGELSRWDVYASYFFDAAAQAPSYPNADFGLITNAKGSNEAGYCNGALYTRNGLLVLVMSYNEECFGTAGCISEALAFFPEPEQLATLANTIQTAILAARAPTNQTQGGPDATIYDLSK